MALDMFMVINTPDIKGESKDKEFGPKGGIDVLAWSWGMSQSGTFHQGGGGGAGKVNVQDLSFTKWIDDASAPLHFACMKGTHIGKCTLTVRKAGDKPYKYFEIIMEKCMVTAASTGGSGGEDRLTENITLNFAKVSVNYFIQGDKGDVKAGTKYVFDIEANAAG
ncbi:Hcp family type VI secretion system effector [Sandaracinobacteroides saxicola]|uniref:Type VI secretion system tube protein Hcp n=1 Tax=Sandaracinobacteroides saxicola TaxID=2759707 RepID=A0A7G5IJ07_9SPHN|nr:type VI secretion system tube protein Hcp [Sandaracinobacteroides saxicola]QMW23349.1 type VI secretion system tube protein Hcp [Sandaracinobacteroides saxicola]